MEIPIREEFQSLITHINQKVSLTDSEVNLLTSRLKYKRYLKGHYIVQEDEISKYETFIISGKVRTFFMDDDGKEHIIAFGLDSWWVGDLCSFATQTPAIFNTQCVSETTVVHISYDDMNTLFIEIPKLERYFRLILQTAYGHMTKRIVQNNAMPAKDRYILFSKTYPKIVEKFPQYMIASYLGISKEFLSTIRKQLTEDSKS